MKKLAFPILASLVGVLTVAVVIQAAQMVRMQRELTQLKRDSDEAKAGPATAAAPEKAKKLEDRIEKLEKRVKLAPKTALKPGEEPGEEFDLPSVIVQDVEALKEKVEDLEKKQKNNGEKKPPLSEVAEALDIDGRTEQEMARMINDGKDRSFALLKIPREDGGTFVDDFVEVFKSGNGESEEAKKVWIRLFSEKIPGTNDTYIGRIMQIQQDVNGGIKTVLNDDQWKKYNQQGLDPLQIQTGHDPWAAYFAQKGVEFPDE